MKTTFKATCFLVLTVCAVGFWLLNSSLKEGCSKIQNIAQDAAKVTYLDNWAMQYVVDQGYYFVTGMHGDIRGSMNGEQIEITPLPPFEKSGIKNEYFRFNVEKTIGDFKTKITSINVGRFEFGYGRNQIIVLKNGTQLNSYMGHNQSSGHLLKVSETTFAYCADSTFEI